MRSVILMAEPLKQHGSIEEDPKRVVEGARETMSRCNIYLAGLTYFMVTMCEGGAKAGNATGSIFR